MDQQKESPSSEIKQKSIDLGKYTIVAVVGLIIFVGAIFVAYRYSQKQKSDLVLPAGVTYLGASPTVYVQPTPLPAKFTVDPSVEWETRKGNIYPYSFSVPSTLKLVVFTGDKTDSIGIVWGDIPPQLNILLNMERIELRDSKLISQPKIEYVRNWWKFFSGLTGVAGVTPFTNTNGLKGYKATYINNVNDTPNLDVFFEIPGQPDKMIHMANGILESSVFDRMVDSVKWNAL